MFYLLILMPVRPWCDFVAEGCGVELKTVSMGNFEFDDIGALLSIVNMVVLVIIFVQLQGRIRIKNETTFGWKNCLLAMLKMFINV